MKLLIADDEKLTREGIISSIDWASLGVSDIYQADDGIHGLELAKQIRPDIVLSDVRMPRLDGIEMSLRLRDLFPDINIIFMSGYSDKEYLKAAIKLKAISYVEKPINPDEIREAVLEALKNRQQMKETIDTKLEHLKFASSSLATRLIYPGTATDQELSAEFGKLSFSVSDTTAFHTMIFSFKKPLSLVSETVTDAFYGKFYKLLRGYGLSEIHGVKQERFLICHIFGVALPHHTLKALVSSAANMAAVLDPGFFIVVGKRVTGASRIYDSYNSAVILLQSCFYHPYGSWFIYENKDPDIRTRTNPPVSMESFQDLLNQKNPKAMESARLFYEALIDSKNMMQSQVKDLYYRMLVCIREAYRFLQLPVPEEGTALPNALETVLSCETVFELNSLLVSELTLFFEQAQLPREESSPVTAIKSFIASHYSDESLSIKDISEHVFLSASYICTIFKNETGQTLNQYITGYRIERAKKLLADPRNKVSDISSRVGYSDGNYFGKAFKKIVGLSPTEYRDQVSGL